MSVVRILDNDYELPALASERFQTLQRQIQAHQQRVRSGRGPQRRLLGVIPRAGAPLSFEERYEALLGLVDDYDQIIEGVRCDRERYQRFFGALAEGVRAGVAARCEAVREMERERGRLEAAACEDDDALLLEQSRLMRDRMLRAVRLMGQATLLILKKIDLCTQSLGRLAEDQDTQRQVLARLVARLDNHRRMRQLERRVEQLEQDIARMAAGALGFEEQLREHLGPLQELLDHVARVDHQLHRAVAEIEDIARAMGEEQGEGVSLGEALDAHDSQVLDFLVSSRLKHDRLRALLAALEGEDGALERFQATLDAGGPEAPPSIEDALGNIEGVIALRLGSRARRALGASGGGAASAGVSSVGAASAEGASIGASWVEATSAGAASAGTGDAAPWALGAPVRALLMRGDAALVGGDRAGALRSWGLSDGALRGAWPWHAGAIEALAASPGDARVATGGRDGCIRLGLPGPAPDEVFAVHADRVLALDFATRGSLLASGGRDSAAIVWELTTRRPLLTLREHPNWVCGVAFVHEDRWLATACVDGVVRLWSVREGTLRDQVEHPMGVEALAASPDRALLASGCWDGLVRVWRVDDAASRVALEGHEGEVSALAFSADGRWLASGCRRGQVRLWSLRAGGAASPAGVVTRHGRAVEAVAFTPDGGRVVSCDASGALEVQARRA